MYNKTIDNLVNLGFHNLCSLWEYIYDSFPGKIRENILFWLFTQKKSLPIFYTSLQTHQCDDTLGQVNLIYTNYRQ